MSSVKIGIIGGSGLDNPDILEGREEKFVNTPFGEPSDVLVEGKIKGVDCVLLARHGRKHEIMPSNINFRANVHALKHEGCTHLVVTTACGSLQEHVKPGDMLFPDQFIDRTQKRIQTFYDATCDDYKGVSHIPMHTPFCEKTRKILIESTQQLGILHHSTGTVLTIEGPRFSSKAESKLWKSWGADIINMTTVPEVVLAKEAGLSYAAIGMVTDYDSWHDDEDPVSVNLVLATFKTNAERAQKILLHAIPKIAQEDWTAIIQENKAVAISSIM